jgi:hypothetical protein
MASSSMSPSLRQNDGAIVAMSRLTTEKFLRELIAYEEFANINKTDSEEPFKVKKGVKSGVVYDPGLQRVEKRLAEKISEINLPFEEELRTIEED